MSKQSSGTICRVDGAGYFNPSTGQDRKRQALRCAHCGGAHSYSTHAGQSFAEPDRSTSAHYDVGASCVIWSLGIKLWFESPYLLSHVKSLDELRNEGIPPPSLKPAKVLLILTL